MFKSDFMEVLSKVHWTVPLYIFVPVIVFFIYLSISGGIGLLSLIGYYAGGLGIWTVTEYVLHRWVFHYEPPADLQWAQRIHFIFHGVHHDYPKDAKRLVMPPSVSLPLATGFYFLFAAFFSTKIYLYAMFPGFLTGYLIYDMMHYAMHHFNFKGSWFKKIKDHHMLHHYDNAEKGYGVSSALWDKIFHSDFPKRS